MIATSSVKDLNFGDIGHKDAKQLRLNNDGGKCVVSYRGRQPRCVDGMREYNRSGSDNSFEVILWANDTFEFRYGGLDAVSYTHLTLPTNREV